MSLDTKELVAAIGKKEGLQIKEGTEAIDIYGNVHTLPEQLLTKKNWSIKTDRGDSWIPKGFSVVYN